MPQGRMNRTITPRVFISSTFRDLEKERKILRDAIIENECYPVCMENFSASSKEQFEIIKEKMDGCDYYVLVVANEYGTINHETGISYTEMEYNLALESGIPILVFEYDPAERQKKFELFKEKLRSGRTTKKCNANNLTTNVITALNNEFRNTQQALNHLPEEEDILLRENKSSQNNTKYQFGENTYKSKGGNGFRPLNWLGFDVLSNYINQNKDKNLVYFQNTFGKIDGGFAVEKKGDPKIWNKGTNERNYSYFDKNEIELDDGTIVLIRYTWSVSSIKEFVKKCKELGVNIEVNE
jgi:hypothetical protein